jgi:hypothetical protein
VIRLTSKGFYIANLALFIMLNMNKKSKKIKKNNWKQAKNPYLIKSYLFRLGWKQGWGTQKDCLILYSSDSFI